MSYGKIVAFALLAGALAVGGAAVARTADSGLDIAGFRLAAQGEPGEHGRRDRDEAREHDRSPGGPALSMRQVLQRLADQGYTDVREIERKRNRYEVEARNRAGQRVELEVDGAAGEILKEERE